jgi:hypothetical protein
LGKNDKYRVDMSKYKINVAYNELLVYDEFTESWYGKSNLSNYDIHPQDVLHDGNILELEKKLNIKFPYIIDTNISNHIKTELHKVYLDKFEFIVDFNKDYTNTISLEHAYNENIEFIYPLVLCNSEIFNKYDTIEIDHKVIQRAHENKAKICILHHIEGYFGREVEDFIWVYNLSKKYGLNKNNFILVTSNFKSIQTYNKLLLDGVIEDNCTIHPYAYFQFDIWFNNIGTLTKSSNIQKMKIDFNYYLKYNKEIKKKYHFLLFNRRPRPHRICIFSQMMADINLKNKSILTIGSEYAPKKYLLNSPNLPKNDKSNFYQKFNNMINDDYKFSKNNILKFLETYNDMLDYTYDSVDLIENKANVLNKEAHSNSFVNIVTETQFEDTMIFFSEKIYKPIYMLQPFILFGNPNSLKTLHKLGFKTFSDWWDESYDDETDFTRKLEKITEIIYEISNWDIDTLYNKTQEMEEVLIHNFNNLMNIKPVNDLFSLLSKY